MKDPEFRLVADVIAVLTAMGYWVVDQMPWIASFLAAVYTAIRIYEWARVRIFKIGMSDPNKPFE